jgi:putative methionine-R-sulfoxide reductase with GAF domain
VTDRATGAVEAVVRIIDREDDADEILRQTVAELADRYSAFAGVRFVEEGELVLGPAAGAPGGEETAVAVRFNDQVVAELVTSALLEGAERAAWDRIAELVSPYCLVGWDTGGEGWEP